MHVDATREDRWNGFSGIFNPIIQNYSYKASDVIQFMSDFRVL